MYVFLGLLATTIVIGMLLPNLRILLGACAFTVLLLYIADIINVKRFGSFYGIDVIDNQIIEISEKKGEKIIGPEDILEIVFPTDLNILGSGSRHKEQFFYIKLKDGTTMSISVTIVSDYTELINKIASFAEHNNVKKTTKITGL